MDAFMRTFRTLTTFAMVVALPLSAQVTSPAANPQSARQLSLDEAVRMGESQSEAVRIARAGVQRSEGQQLQAKSQYLPQIFASGSYTRTLKSQYSGSFGSSAPDTTTSPDEPA